MIVIWDPAKAAANFRKHGVSFEEAESVLNSGRQLLLEDHDHSELRFVALGYSIRLRLLVVVYCYRFEDVLRIISARKATRRERGIYEKRI